MNMCIAAPPAFAREIDEARKAIGYAQWRISNFKASAHRGILRPALDDVTVCSGRQIQHRASITDKMVPPRRQGGWLDRSARRIFQVNPARQRRVPFSLEKNHLHTRRSRFATAQ